MQVTNIRGHRIRWSLLAAQGAVVGIFSALVMLVLAMILYPAFSDGSDVWTFTKVVSSVLLGDDAATPLSGFDAAPVLVGLLLHLSIGAVAGITYALIVAMFDLEGWTPVALFGLLYGAMLFVWSYVLIGAGIGGEVIQNLPVVLMLWTNIVFGITSGLLLATWADRADIDQIESERVPVFEGDLDHPATHRTLH